MHVHEAARVLAESLRKELGDTGKRVAVLFDCVQLGAVARREDHAFANDAALAESRALANGFLRAERELLTHFDGRSTVAQTRDHHCHDSTRCEREPSSTDVQKSSAISSGAAS